MDMASFKLPRFVIFQGDNGYNLCHWAQNGHEYLQFNSTNRELYGSQEVIPVPDYEDVVMIKNLYSQKFWRLYSDWAVIFADWSDKPSSGNRECLFKVVRIDDKTVALQCLANSRYLGRGTGQAGWDWDCLFAGTSDYSTDSRSHLRVTSALTIRHVFDVKYDMDDKTNTKPTTITLGSAPVTNDTSSKTDLQVAVPFKFEKKSSWRTVTTFNTGLNLQVTAGIPNFLDGSVSEEFSTLVENGIMHSEKIHQTRLITVKDVAPGETVKVEMRGVRIEATVPFKYKYVDTRVDGMKLPEDSGKDGVFEGVQVINIKEHVVRD